MAKATIVINAKDNTKNALGAMKKNLMSLSGILTTGAIAVAFNKFGSLAEEQNSNMAALANTAKNLGQSYGNLQKDVESLTSALQEKTAVGDEAQIKAMDMMALSTGDLKLAMEKLPNALDFAASSKMELTSATRMYSKALAGNMTALSAAMPWVRDWIKQGKTNAEVMIEVDRRTKGAAEAMGDVKPLTKFKNTMGDIGEKIGGMLLPIISALQKIMVALGNDVTLAIGVLVGLLMILPKINIALKAMGVAAQLSLGPYALITGAILGLVVGFKLLWDKFAGFRAFWKTTWAIISDLAKKAVAFVVEKFDVFWNSITDVWETMEGFRDGFKSIMKFIMGYARFVIKTIVGFFTTLGSSIMDIIQAFKDPLNMDSWKNAFKNIGKNFKDFGVETKDTFLEIGGNSASNFLKGMISKVKDSGFAQKYNEVLKKEIEKNAETMPAGTKPSLPIEDTIELTKAEEDPKVVANKTALETMAEDWGNYTLLVNKMQASMVSGIQNSFSSLLTSIIDTTKTGAEKWKAFGASLLNTLASSVSQMVSKWLIGKVMMDAISSAFASKEVSKNAVVAGSGAAASQASIPIIGPVLAIAAMGAMFAAVLGMKSKGGFQTPEGANRIIPGTAGDAVPIIAHGGETIGRGGGSGFTINFTGTSFNSDETASAIMEMIRDRQLVTGEQLL